MELEIFSAAWFSALVAIIFIDILLAGDNAVVIALAARNLPAHLKKKAIIFGTMLAIGLRAVLTFFVSFLLQIPFLSLVGGLILFYIAWKMLADKPEESGGETGATFMQALKIIVIADTTMALDNVLAVAGAAQGDFLLIILGLLISIPIVMGGSVLTLQLMTRFPQIVLAGVALLAFVAFKLIWTDGILLPIIESAITDWFGDGWITLIKWGVGLLVAAIFTLIAKRYA